MRYVAVFDTNILISALLSTNGNPFRCLALAKIGQIESVTCQEILNEFAEKLVIKFKFSQEIAKAAVEEVCQRGQLAYVSGHIPVAQDGSVVGPFGKLDAEITVDQGYEAAKLVALTMISSLQRTLGSLDRVTA